MAFTALMKQAKGLYDLGFAIHWLRPHSKIPLESGWTTGPRHDWEYLKKTYRPGLNVGVRLGAPSALGRRDFLAVIDVDIKSEDKRHLKEAIKAAEALLKGATCPVVMSGRGHGSRHYYCVTDAPFECFNPARSDEFVKVMMPSKQPSKKELTELTDGEIRQGLRIARAWEVSLYSSGRQVVLPPSIHPDSNREYYWGRPPKSVADFPLVSFDIPEEKRSTPQPQSEGRESSSKASPFGAARAEGLEAETAKSEAFSFKLADVELAWLDISDRVKKGILTGEGVTDRSAFLLPACTALLSAGLSRDEILTVLTESSTFLGACAYDHAKTKNRTRAALWVWKYTLKKVMNERAASLEFLKSAEIEALPKLSETKIKEQESELTKEAGWKAKLEKTQQGKIRSTIVNCHVLLTNLCPAPGFVGRNEFSEADYFLCDTPWLSKKGEPVVDMDTIRIKTHCAKHFGVEFSSGIIEETILSIADSNRFHPVKEWLTSLKWDGVSRIGSWLKDYAGAEAPEPYLTDISRKFLVGMVARIFQPGVKFDTTLILEGTQGAGKSTLLEKLVGEAWFTDAALIVGDKDAVLTLQAKWLVELGELSAMSKADLEGFKAFIARRTDRIRAPYGKRIEEFPRQNVFAGTTNLDEYLRDLTGNRRYWVVKLTAKKIDFDSVEKLRDQFFAEAVHYYQKKEVLWLTKDSEEQAKAQQAVRLEKDEWMGLIDDAVNADNFPRESFEMREVAAKLDQVGAHKLSSGDCRRIARCLTLLGFERFQETTGRRRRLWRAGPEFFRHGSELEVKKPTNPRPDWNRTIGSKQNVEIPDFF